MTTTHKTDRADYRALPAAITDAIDGLGMSIYTFAITVLIVAPVFL